MLEFHQLPWRERFSSTGRSSQFLGTGQGRAPFDQQHTCSRSTSFMSTFTPMAFLLISCQSQPHFEGEPSFPPPTRSRSRRRSPEKRSRSEGLDRVVQDAQAKGHILHRDPLIVAVRQQLRSRPPRFRLHRVEAVGNHTAGHEKPRI